MPASALAARELRYCDACVGEDLSNFGAPRWRLAHQLSCAYVCPEHGIVLSSLRRKVSTWLLPPRGDAATRLPGGTVRPAVAAESLQRLAHLALKCVGVDAIEIDLVRAAVLHRLRQEGIARWHFPVDEARVAGWFRGTDLARALRCMPSTAARLADGAWVHPLLRRRREEHPVLWLMLWCATHPEYRVDALTSGLLEPAASPVTWDERGQGCLWSTRRFALPPGVGDLIARSGSLKQASRSLGISVFTLRRHLELEGCHGREFFGEMRTSQRREDALEVIRQYRSLNPGCSRTAVHTDCKAAVTWLARNAKEDLARVLAAIPERRPRQLDLLGPVRSYLEPEGGTGHD